MHLYKHLNAPASRLRLRSSHSRSDGTPLGQHRRTRDLTTPPLPPLAMVAAYVLTPTTSGEERGRPAAWEGIAVNGSSVHATDDGRIPAMLLEPTLLDRATIS